MFLPESTLKRLNPDGLTTIDSEFADEIFRETAYVVAQCKSLCSTFLSTTFDTDEYDAALYFMEKALDQIHDALSCVTVSANGESARIRIPISHVSQKTLKDYEKHTETADSIHERALQLDDELMDFIMYGVTLAEDGDAVGVESSPEHIKQVLYECMRDMFKYAFGRGCEYQKRKEERNAKKETER